MTSSSEDLAELVEQAYQRHVRKNRGVLLLAIGFTAVALLEYGEGWIFWLWVAGAVVCAGLGAINSYESGTAKHRRLQTLIRGEPARIVWISISTGVNKRFFVTFHDDRGEQWSRLIPEENQSAIRALIAELFPEAYVGPGDTRKYEEWMKSPAAPREWKRQQETAGTP